MSLSQSDVDTDTRDVTTVTSQDSVTMVTEEDKQPPVLTIEDSPTPSPVVPVIGNVGLLIC